MKKETIKIIAKFILWCCPWTIIGIGFGTLICKVYDKIMNKK